MKRLRRMRCIQAGKLVPGMKLSWADKALHTASWTRSSRARTVTCQGKRLDTKLGQDGDDLLVEWLPSC